MHFLLKNNLQHLKNLPWLSIAQKESRQFEIVIMYEKC